MQAYNDLEDSDYQGTELSPRGRMSKQGHPLHSVA